MGKLAEELRGYGYLEMYLGGFRDKYADFR